MSASKFPVFVLVSGIELECVYLLTDAVHFLLRDHLDRGFNSTSTYDTLGKNVCEYLVSITACTLISCGI